MSDIMRLRKRIKLTVILVGVLCLGLCACRGQKEDKQDQALSKFREKACSQNTIDLQIELLGENEANITVNSEAIGLLDSRVHRDADKRIKELSIILFTEDDDRIIGFDIKDKSSLLYAKNPNEADLESLNQDYLFNDIRTNSSFSTNAHKLGLASEFNQCTNYEVRVYFNKSFKYEIIAEGKVADILSKKDRKPLLSLVRPDPESIKFKISGEEAKTNFFIDDNVDIYIFDSEKDLNYGFANSIMDISVWPFEEGKNCKMAKCTVDNEGIPQDLGEDRDHKIGRATASESGVTIKYVHERIGEFVKPDYFYQLYCGSDFIECGRLSDIIIDEEYSSILPFPDWVPKNNKDREFLIPDTNEYTLAVLEVPSAIENVPDWHDQAGNVVYGGIRREKIPLTLVVLDSYDEFGLISSKYKIIYPSAEDAKYAVVGDEMIVGQEANDELVTDELFDKYDKSTFDGNDYVDYQGLFENVRYFELSNKGIDRRLDGDVCDLLMTNVNKLHFDFNSVKVKHLEKLSSTQQASQNSLGTYNLATYSTRHTETKSYEELNKLYRALPDDWREHPLLSLLPPTPEGVSLYYNDNPINSNSIKHLNLSSKDKGCTREEAVNFIKEIESMYSEEEDGYCNYYDEKNFISIIVETKDGDEIGVHWNKAFKYLHIRVDKR